MDFNKLTLFAGMAERMRYLGQRQTIIAQNIANANTPGYHARDMKPMDFANVLAAQNSGVTMARTNPAHLGGNGAAFDFAVKEKTRGYETTISGNNVVLEEEMQKLGDTSASYEQTTALYKKISDMVKLASGSR